MIFQENHCLPEQKNNSLIIREILKNSTNYQDNT